MEYNIERFCKAGLRNLNGYVFDVETTNKALDNYINKPIVLINNGKVSGNQQSINLMFVMIQVASV